MTGTRLSLDDALRLAEAALVAAGATPENAKPTAAALVAAEVDGQPGHGLSRVASYALQLRAGKVDGAARPVLAQSALATASVDAGTGFAYPAIECAIRFLIAAAPGSGIAAVAIQNSHHFGQAGRHVEQLANAGLVALAFANSPRAMAFHGGRQAMMGTNPIAFAAPLAGRAPLVVDMSLSVAARGKIMAAKKAGATIPEGWAVDSAGQPTTDPAAALDGSLLPIGGAKGGALALMVEILAAALCGGAFGWEASSLFDAEGGPPRLGQLLIAISPEAFGGTDFAARMEVLAGAVAAQAPARLPGDRRLLARAKAQREGLLLPSALHAELMELASA